MEWLARYHRSEVIGANNVPREGGVVVAGTHSLASYELFIISHFSDEVLGRTTYIIGDDILFKLPGFRDFFPEINFIPGSRKTAVDRLRAGDLLGIAPGGMKEALRGPDQRYSYDWSRRKGFAHVAMKAGVPVVPVACPNADNIYRMVPNPITPKAYELFKIPVPLAMGRWGSPIPRPVKLVHWLGDPIVPDVAPDQATDHDVDAFHRKILRALDELVDRAVTVGENPSAIGYETMALGDWR
jgi:1-acyl-sn-glycerol-3-phosphate acyltransferase